MRTKYHQQRNNKRRVSQVLLSAAVLVLIILVLSLTGQMQVTAKYIYASALSSVSSITSKLEATQSTLTPKSALLKENQSMREQLQELQTVSMFNHALELENQNLRALLNTRIGNKPDKTISKKPVAYLARIIDYKDAPYGTVLAKTNNSTVEPGDMAVFGKMVVGDVAEVNGDYLLIRLITASGRSSDVSVNNNTAIFVGSSNNTGLITLSRTVPIQIGDIVTLPRANGLLVGTVEYIDRDSQDSMQVLGVKAPITTPQLHFISIIND